MQTENEINLFSRQRNLRIKPIDTKRLKVMDPNVKAMLEYKQFKRNYQANANQMPKLMKHKSKSTEKSIQQNNVKLLSQSVDYKVKTNASTLSLAVSDNSILKKGVIYESNGTQVYKVQIEEHLTQYALKISRLNLNNCSKEVYFLQQLRHPNIIEMKHHFATFEKGSDNKAFINIVMPLMTCNLKQFLSQFHKYNQNTTQSSEQFQSKYNVPQSHQFIRKKKKAPIILYKLFIYQLVRAIAFLHQKKITHRDIHPKNVLVDLDALDLRICDFNSAKILQHQISNTSYIGERNYRAPELLLGSKFYGHTVDIWATGCVIAECFLGTQLFNGNNTVETMADIIKLLGTPKPIELKNMKSPILDLKMPDIPKFPMAMRFQEQQIDYLVDLLEKTLVYDPNKRISAFDMLLHPFFNEIKQPNMKINSKSLPNIFNFTREELLIPEYQINQFRLVPDWYLDKQKRFEYLKTSLEDAQLILDK